VNAEIIAIGTELLLGEIADTNSAHIARRLREVGLDLWWMSAVGDNEARIAELINQARQRSAIVITSGGLGPTVDDPTRAAVARAFGVPLEFRPELWAQIEARFVRYGRRATENNRKQAYVPAGALALENPVGTAPCFIVEHPAGAVISLPGVPRELEYMLEHAVLPYIREHMTQAAVIRSRTLRTVGIGESLIDARIAELEELSNPTVGLAAHPGQTDVRITAKAATEAEADALLDPLEADLRRRLGEFIYAMGKAEVEDVVAELLVARGQTVAVGETGTAGDVAQRLSRLPAAPQLFRGGVLVESSAPTAGELAELAAASADWGLGVKLDLAADPPFLEIALAGSAGVETQKLGFGGHPGLAVRWVGTAALNMLRLKLIRPS
jgi:competence/damage-inducible protein CinA-like protein